jgi:peptidoglycan/xylan/chitin deacetylase (PgdA/CDA1 family)
MRLWGHCAPGALAARGALVLAPLVAALVAAGGLSGCSRVAHQAQAGAASLHRTTATSAAPHGVPTFPGLPVSAGTRDKRLVAITFDSNMTTSMLHELDSHRVKTFDNSAVVDQLDRLDVPATFFLAGLWMQRYPDEVRRLAADPRFELGSHSYAHRPFSAPCFGLGSALPVAQMADDVQQSFDVLRRFTDHPVPYFRFPGGCYNQAALDALGPTGVTMIQYDVASGDSFGLSVKGIVDHVMSSVKNGSIIVMHITGGNTAPLTAKALPGVVAALRDAGYTLVKVSDLLAAGPPLRAGPRGAVSKTGKVSKPSSRVRSGGEPARTSRSVR